MAIQEAAVDRATQAVAGVVHRQMVATAAATTAVAHAHPTLASQGRTQVTAMSVASRAVNNVAHKPHAHHGTNSPARREMKYNARTHAAPALTWVSSATTLTNASPPVMCQRAFHLQVCQHAAAVAEAAIVAVAAETSAVAAVRAQVAAVAVATPAAGFGADRLAASV